MLRFVGLLPKFVTRVNAGAACAGPTPSVAVSVAVSTVSGSSAAASIAPVRRLIYGASFVDVLVMKGPDDLHCRAGVGRPPAPIHRRHVHVHLSPTPRSCGGPPRSPPDRSFP